MNYLILALLTMTFLLTSCSTSNAEIYQQGVVYVIFEREGEAAVKADDVDQNGVPDVVEDIATQINAARAVFHDVCGLPDPFKSDRYKNVSTIEVDINPKAKMTNHNGLAHSGLRKAKHDPSIKTLHIQIASSVDPRKNSTPLHEYFHLIQYGATYFRNGWYLEGMARWSQDAIDEIKEYPSERNFAWTLKDKVSEAKIFTAKYNAAKLLWYPLVVDLDDKKKLPRSVTKKYKYVDGTSVFKDNVFYGADVMKRVLAAMKSAEATASESFGGQKQWRKDGVRSEQNNEIILDCVRAVYASERK